jgi:single-stranded-DNA-specific exonuclease
MKFAWSMAAPRPELCGPLANALNITPLLAQCLANRGLVESEAVSRFLQPRLKNLSDPYLIPNMGAAVERLLTARQLDQLVVIFGDYDVDGVTSTALLIESLRALGWRVECYLPHRLDDGYGLSHDGVERCLQKFPVKLLLAVDCGSTAVEVIGRLQRDGIDVIVVDHHQISNPAPAAVALINPQLGPDFRELCSAGLAFKLVHALVKRMRELGIEAAAAIDIRAQLDLVALGTIADLAPLAGENRILVASGLERLSAGPRAGLAALKKVAASPAITGCYEAGFQLAPRLNAAGRLEDADAALQLLLTNDPAQAASLAAQLDGNNSRRREIERLICDDIVGMVRARFDPQRDFVIVEGRAEWHIGVVGIVASRVLQEFYRPTLVFGGDGLIWRGSGRSIEGFDLAAALRGCDELLVRHGGHAMAAGVSIQSEKVDHLRQRLNGLAQAALRPEQLHPCLQLDAEVTLSELGVDQVAELARLAPMGQGNPAVRLALRGVSHRTAPRQMGRDAQHVKFFLTDGRCAIEAVWWNGGHATWPEDRFDIAVIPEVNDYKGRRSVQLKLLDWRPCAESVTPSLLPR